MRERDAFGSEMRALGIGVFERELYYPAPGGGSATGTRPRLSSGALGDAFADFQESASVPEGTILKLTRSQTFKNWMVKDIDKNYVALQIDQRRPKNRRVLFVQNSTVCDFHPALTADHTGNVDVVECAAPPAQLDAKSFEQQWIIRILFLVALIRVEAVAKRNKSGPLDKRIKARMKEQIDMRKRIDEVLREIDERNAGFKIGTLFSGLSWQNTIERSYYPLDFLIDGPFVLTNLEHYTLLECMEEARQKRKLKPDALDALKSQADTKQVAGTMEELGTQLDSLKPLFTKSRGKTVLSGFENFYFARRLIHRRWQALDPKSRDWKSDPEISEMRQAHADVIFPPGLQYA